MNAILQPKRLESLDILRGFDLFCLVMFQPILVSLITNLDIEFLNPILSQFEHVEWEGFAFWDLIMPLFVFMSGISIPFAMSKYKKGEKVDSAFWFRLIKRFFVLFALGWVVQGNLLSLDPYQFKIFANTLQAIAVGYIVSAIAFVFTSFRSQIAIACGAFLSYILIFAIWGKMDFTPENNIAEIVDRVVLGSLRDGVRWDVNGEWEFSPNYRYTWIVSSLNFIVTAMLGLFAGHLLYDKQKTPIHKFWILVTVGVTLVVTAYLLSPIVPIIKKIWSSSMTLLSGGYCYMLMALFFYIVDIKRKKKYLLWLKWYGLNSIVAYCVFFVVDFSSITNSLLFGLEPYLGVFYSTVITLVNALVVLYLVYYLNSKKLYFKA